MADKEIVIGVGSEAKAFKDGIETGVIAPVEDAVEALKDLGDSKGPDKLEDGFKGAQKATEKLGRETKDLGDAIEREARQAYRKLGDEAQKGTREASEGMKDLKDEATQSARETAASFSDVNDALDLVQEVAANALSGFGPAGVAAGTIAAIGIGAVTEAFRMQQEEVDKVKERLSGMYTEAIEEGRAYIDEAQILKEMLDIMWNPDRANEYNDAVNDSKFLNMELGDVLAARAGDLKAIEEIQARVNAMQAEPQGSIGNIWGETLGLIERRYEGIGTAIEENNAKAEETLRIEAKYQSEQTAAHRQNMDALDEKWSKYEETIKKMQGAPQPVITPTLDDSGVRTALDALARRTYRINVEAQVRDKYGRAIL